MESFQSSEHLQGCVERVTFHSEETGFCVLRIKAKRHRDLVTVIGNAAHITAGESIECSGRWITDKKHGLQFKTDCLKSIPPTTLEGIKKYLASGLIKGIGPFFAKKMVRTFGEAVFDVIENHPERLTELEGVGEKRKNIITAAWTEQKSIRNIMIFLQSHGVGTARSVRIYKTYGENAIEVVQNNPYRLALDIHGIGFKTADTLASSLKIPKDSILRAQAGIRHVLQEWCNNGHCAKEQEPLIDSSAELLDIPKPTIKDALLRELKEENLINEKHDDSLYIFPSSLFQAESLTAQHLLRLRGDAPPWGKINIEKAIHWAEEKTRLEFPESQKQAIRTVLQNKLSVITGGPGVGKTTIVHALLKIIRAKKCFVALAAPTGRAAKRLSEVTGLPGKTIHRLLEFNPRTFSFKHNQDNPLPIDVLVVDEASMIDIVLMYHLVKAIPPHAAIIFVGDVDQLPSVGPGNVLSDIIHSEIMPVVKLTEIFRQATHSKIILNAHRINQGDFPLPNDSAPCDFYTLYTETVEEAHDKLIQMVTNRIPNHFQCHPIRDIQVLTPMNRGGLGSRALNIALQEQLNSHSEPKISRYGWTFAPNDKVIQNINNYDKDVFNGDIGTITHANLEEGYLKISFDDRLVEYNFSELDEISLAYATTIHKSQGSEYPIVVIPLVTQHYPLLLRNLLYTGVTRGKKLVVLIGQKKALSIAIRNFKSVNRMTRLKERLNQAFNI